VQGEREFLGISFLFEGDEGGRERERQRDTQRETERNKETER
jgi:hypothetical protein